MADQNASATVVVVPAAVDSVEVQPDSAEVMVGGMQGLHGAGVRRGRDGAVRSTGGVDDGEWCDCDGERDRDGHGRGRRHDDGHGDGGGGERRREGGGAHDAATRRRTDLLRGHYF